MKNWSERNGQRKFVLKGEVVPWHSKQVSERRTVRTLVIQKIIWGAALRASRLISPFPLLGLWSHGLPCWSVCLNLPANACRSLVWSSWSTCLRATKLVCHNFWAWAPGLHALQLKPRIHKRSHCLRSLSTAARVAPRDAAKAHAQQQDPVHPKTNKLLIKTWGSSVTLCVSYSVRPGP